MSFVFSVLCINLLLTFKVSILDMMCLERFILWRDLNGFCRVIVSRNAACLLKINDWYDEAVVTVAGHCIDANWLRYEGMYEHIRRLMNAACWQTASCLQRYASILLSLCWRRITIDCCQRQSCQTSPPMSTQSQCYLGHRKWMTFQSMCRLLNLWCHTLGNLNNTQCFVYTFY